MITTVIGKLFLQTYNEKNGTSYDAERFFVEKYHPLFFDSNKYLYWVQNSPFVQMRKKQKLETLTESDRKEKLNEFLEKVNQGFSDASVAIGYPASEEKEFNTTSGQISNLTIPVSKEDVFYSWIGAALGVGVQGGISIFFYNAQILYDIYEGWELYRKGIEEMDKIPGNKINTWNGQWLSHRYGKSFQFSNYRANFNPYEKKGQEIIIPTVSWTKILIGISRCFPGIQLMGYIYSFGQTNTTIGFIPFDLSQISKPLDVYQKFFGMESGRKAEELWGTERGFVESCKEGVIGLRAMEPKRLKIEKGKMLKGPSEDQEINFNTYKIWIMAMINNQELWDKARGFAEELYKYKYLSDRGKTVNANKVTTVLESVNKQQFIKGLTAIVGDVEDTKQILDIAKEVNMMPSDNVPYFLTLIRFNFAEIDNRKQ